MGTLELIPLGLTHNLSVVMPGLVPGTHVLLQPSSKQAVGGRDKPGHDAVGVSTRSEHALVVGLGGLLVRMRDRAVVLDQG